MWQPDRLGGRPPTVKNVTIGQTRSTARSTQRNRELCSQTRSTARSTDLVSARRAQVCARRSTAWVDRPMVRSTVRVDRPGLSAQTWVRKTGKKYFNKSFIFSENTIKLVLTFYIETQTSDKNFKTIYQHINSFLSLANFIKNQNRYFIKLGFFQNMNRIVKISLYKKLSMYVYLEHI